MLLGLIACRGTAPGYGASYFSAESVPNSPSEDAECLFQGITADSLLFAQQIKIFLRDAVKGVAAAGFAFAAAGVADSLGKLALGGALAGGVEIL